MAKPVDEGANAEKLDDAKAKSAAPAKEEKLQLKSSVESAINWIKSSISKKWTKK